MAARIAFIHTVGFLVEDFRLRVREDLGGVDAFHILNESLLQDLLRGAALQQVYRRVTEQIQLAADAGADLIAVTCSSTSPAVDTARKLVCQPILKIDDPMMAQAVRVGGRIGLLCTAASTVAPSTALLQAHAAEQGRSATIVPLVNPDAYKALMAGDRGRHDDMVRASAMALAKEVDVLVLAQASLAHLQGGLSAHLGCPVLASPPMLMQAIKSRLQQLPAT
jgi:Asp/Glu/hydantoin racemase